jgi:hypothetical protein
MSMPINSLVALINELHKWQTEKRVAFAVYLAMGDPHGYGAAAVFTRGEIHDISGLRLQITGDGRGAFLLAGAELGPAVLPGITDAIEDMQDGPPIDWSSVIGMKFPNGNILALWSASQADMSLHQRS